MSSNENFERLWNSPKARLCQALQASNVFVTFTLMGRVGGAAERYVITQSVLDAVGKVLSDPGHTELSSPCHEGQLHARLIELMHEAYTSASPEAGNTETSRYREYRLPGKCVSSLRQLMTSGDYRPYLPGEPLFMELKHELAEAYHRPASEDVAPGRSP